jgi:hypothetical protein
MITITDPSANSYLFVAGQGDNNSRQCLFCSQDRLKSFCSVFGKASGGSIASSEDVHLFYITMTEAVVVEERNAVKKFGERKFETRDWRG